MNQTNQDLITFSARDKGYDDDKRDMMIDLNAKLTTTEINFLKGVMVHDEKYFDFIGTVSKKGLKTPADDADIERCRTVLDDKE